MKVSFKYPRNVKGHHYPVGEHDMPDEHAEDPFFLACLANRDCAYVVKPGGKQSVKTDESNPPKPSHDPRSLLKTEGKDFGKKANKTQVSPSGDSAAQTDASSSSDDNKAPSESADTKPATTQKPNGNKKP